MFSARNNISLKFTSPTKKLFAGFTLIEFIVAIMIIFLVFTVGMANVRGFQRRKVLEGAAIRVVSHLRLAQQMAMSGAKPAGCADFQLLSVTFSVDTTNTYTIIAQCSDGHDHSYQTTSYSLLPDYSGIGFNVSPPDVVFNILGRGVVEDVTLTLTQDVTSESRNIIITQGGEIR